MQCHRLSCASSVSREKRLISTREFGTCFFLLLLITEALQVTDIFETYSYRTSCVKSFESKDNVQKEAIPLSSQYIGSVASSQSEAAVY